MIYALFGENSFAASQELERLVNEFGDKPEKYDGENLSIKDLPDIFMSTTLFSSQRLIIIKNIASNTAIWNVLGEWLPRLADDITLVLMDAKPDKRTSTYKALQKTATIKDFPAWTERDSLTAQKWVQTEAKRQGVELSAQLAKLLVQRIGVNQWALFREIEKIGLLGTVSEQDIIDSTDARPQDNVFSLLELALKGERRSVAEQIRSLKRHEDPHRLLALLASQVVQLAAVQAAGSDDNPVKDFAIHPFVASKLNQQAKKLTKTDMRRIITALADADSDMKQSRGEPWLLIERALLTITAK